MSTNTITAISKAINKLASNGKPAQKPKSKPKPKGKAKKRMPLPQTISRVMLSECTRNYATVLNNPMSAYENGLTACVPDEVTFPTLKRSFMLRGSATIGSGRVGYVLFNPYAPGGSLADNVRVSSAATTISEVMAFSLDPGVVGFAFNNAECGGDPTFTAGLAEYRIVGAEIQLTYNGALLSRGGVYTALHNAHNDSMNGWAPTNVYATQTANVQPITSQMMRTRWLPASSGDLGFLSTPTAFFSNAIIMAGDPGLTFTWVAAVHYEFIGRNFRSVGGVTPSLSDSAGLSATINAANATRDHPIPTAKFLERVADAFVATTSYVAQGVGYGAVAALATSTSRAMNRLAI